MLRNALDSNEKKRREGLAVLKVISSAHALAVKDADWAAEQEVRMIFIAFEDAQIHSIQGIRADGSPTRYLEVPVTSKRRMWLKEITLGPNQDMRDAEAQARGILDAAGYRPTNRKYPRIVVSGHR